MAGLGQFHVGMTLILGFMFAVTNMSTIGAAAHDLSHRQMSSFVRKSLGGPSRNYYVPGLSTSSSSSRFRRLAGSANCSSSPNLCSDATNFPAGATCCASTCVDLQVDNNHCGFCSYKCAASLGCCGGTCVSTMTDNTNCGSCGISCKRSLCSNGFCGYAG